MNTTLLVVAAIHGLVALACAIPISVAYAYTIAGKLPPRIWAMRASAAGKVSGIVLQSAVACYLVAFIVGCGGEQPPIYDPTDLTISATGEGSASVLGDLDVAGEVGICVEHDAAIYGLPVTVRACEILVGDAPDFCLVATVHVGGESYGRGYIPAASTAGCGAHFVPFTLAASSSPAE